MPDLVDAAGVKIPESLASCLDSLAAFRPNDWNPNKMDSFVRDRLIRAIKKDGFIVPVIVRPHPDGIGWQIVDGEHRWQIARELGMSEIPFVNLGPISDDDAKQITIKANTLSGEFDAVELAKIIKDLSDSAGGLNVLSEELPYTPERLSGMIALLGGADDFGMPEGLSAGDGPDDDDGAADKPKGTAASEFKAFDPDEMEFDHECPRCKFKFNTPAGA